MAKIRNVDLGTVTDVTPEYVRRLHYLEMVGVPGSYPRNLETESNRFRIAGFLANPTQAQREAFHSLRDGNPAIIDLGSEEGIYGWGKVASKEFMLREREAGIWNYQMVVAMIPCIGTMKMLSDDGRFSDLNYYRSTKVLDPFAGYHAVTLASLLTHQDEFYMFNSNAGATKTLEFEKWCGNDLTRVDIWGWKSAAWDLVGSWYSGGTAFGATVAWTDEDTQAHTFRVNHDVRGATVANFTEKVSKSLGTTRRAMIQITNMTAYPATYGLSTKHGQYQLLLRVKLTHTQRETARPYAIVTYFDGGFGFPPA
jgi:hypothetical protein